MFAEASMEVVLSGSEAMFSFPEPLSVMLLYVYDDHGELVWRLVANEVTGLPASEGTFAAVPISDLPVEVSALIPLALAKDIPPPQEDGPVKVPLTSIRYGVVPEGYREEAPARPLSPGGYDVSVIAKWARADSHFDVPNA